MTSPAQPITSTAALPLTAQRSSAQPINSRVWRKSQTQARRTNRSGSAPWPHSAGEAWGCGPGILRRCRLCRPLTVVNSCANLHVFLRRSCSIDKCPLSPGALSLISQKRDMVRSESLRVDSGERTHRIFRPSDLIHGEVLGKGFFGQAVKVQHLLPLRVMRDSLQEF